MLQQQLWKHTMLLPRGISTCITVIVDDRGMLQSLQCAQQLYCKNCQYLTLQCMRGVCDAIASQWEVMVVSAMGEANLSCGACDPKTTHGALAPATVLTIEDHCLALKVCCTALCDLVHCLTHSTQLPCWLTTVNVIASNVTVGKGLRCGSASSLLSCRHITGGRLRTHQGVTEPETHTVH